MAASAGGATPLFRPLMLATPWALDRGWAGAWHFERKLDGLRCLAVRREGRVHLLSRNDLSFDSRFPEVIAALSALPADDFAMDGEIAAFDGDRTSFSRLQGERGSAVVAYCAFDLLHLLGRETTHLQLAERRDLLRAVLLGSGEPLRMVEGVEAEGNQAASLLHQACAAGWEGLVAKQVGSAYVGGRSPLWRKLKCLASQELVVGGWSDPSGARAGFGALLVGYYDDRGLRYAGKVGTGFTDAVLADLAAQLRTLSQDASPFVDPLPAKGNHWVRPELVAEVTFTEWTPDGHLRHPSYRGLRPDKAGRDVRREM
ncbi:MAG: non-homologous end-joining DNA ligase [Acidimicrobiales bacterium]